MREYDIYLPTTLDDGTPYEAAIIEQVKRSLRDAFGGYTHLTHRCEGAWSMGGVELLEDVTILRVLDDGSSGFDMCGFKRNLEIVLKQREVLIVFREVGKVS
jgi:hypothetical protein